MLSGDECPCEQRDHTTPDAHRTTIRARRLHSSDRPSMLRAPARSCLIAAMGFGFWFKLAALAVAVAIVAVIVLLLITSAFAAWGIFGGLLALAIVLMLIGWISDRRRARADMQ